VGDLVFPGRDLFSPRRRERKLKRARLQPLKLGVLLEEFSGFLRADPYSGYDELYEDPERDVTEVACWAHVRRKFYEAQSSDLMRSMVMLADRQYIGR